MKRKIFFTAISIVMLLIFTGCDAEYFEENYTHNLPYKLEIEDRAFVLTVAPQNDAEAIVVKYFYSTIMQDRNALNSILADGVQIGYANETQFYNVFYISSCADGFLCQMASLVDELELAEHSVVTAGFSRIVGNFLAELHANFLVGRASKYDQLQVFGFEYTRPQFATRAIMRTVFDHNLPVPTWQIPYRGDCSNFINCICDNVIADCNYTDYSEIDYWLYRWGVHHRRNETVNPMLRAAGRYFLYSIDYADGIMPEYLHDVLGNAYMHDSHVALILNERDPFSHMLYPGRSMSFGVNRARILFCGDSSMSYTISDMFLRSMVLYDWDKWLLLIEHHNLTQYALISLGFSYIQFPMQDDVLFYSGLMNRLLLVGRTKNDSNWRIYEVARMEPFG